MGKRYKKKYEPAKRIARLKKKNRELKDGYLTQEDIYNKKIKKCLEEQKQQFDVQQIMARLKLASERSDHYVTRNKLSQEETARLDAEFLLDKEKIEHEKTKKHLARYEGNKVVRFITSIFW